MQTENAISGETVGRPMEILLVEDSVVAARFAIKSLEAGAIPHHITWLSDGISAANFLKRQGRFVRAPRPDLVLLDLSLPGLSGHELLKTVRNDEDLSRTPVVVISISDDSSERDSIQALGIDGFLQKPFEMNAFLATIQNINDRRNQVTSRREARTAEQTL